jgi:hypothetical protein
LGEVGALNGLADRSAELGKPVTLTAFEIVLGIDDLPFITIVAARWPSERQNPAQQVNSLHVGVGGGGHDSLSTKR